MRPGRQWGLERPRHGSWLGWPARAILLCASLLAAGPAARGADVKIEGLRVGFVNSSSESNLFKIGAWTPLWVQLTGGSERFSGQIEIEVPDDSGTPTYVTTDVDVAPGETPLPFVLYARPGTRDPNFSIRLIDRSGRRGRAVDGSNFAQLTPVGADESVVLTLGKPQGVEQVPGLPGFASDQTISGQSVSVARVETPPARWYGYDAAEAIILDTNDKAVMELLALRGQAIVDWVARGGHLVVAVNANWQATRDSVIGPILPAVPTGQERLSPLDLKTLDVFATATKTIASPESPPTMVAKLDQVEERGGKALSIVANVPLIVRGSHGFGRVTLIGLDVDQKPFAEWPDRAKFWVRAIDLRRVGTTASADLGVQIGGGGRRIYQSGVSDLSTQLRQALEQFPGIKLIPFGWVAFFIFLYILLIGPGDYFFLKKVVKRMEYTWVTFPLIVITVSLAAYYAAYFVKGRDLRVNKVDVVDVDQTTSQARGTTFVNMFSPQNRDYDVAVLPLPLDAPAGAKPPAAIMADSDAMPRPPSGTEVLTTWLGVPESGFGGMGGTGRLGFSGGGYRSSPPGGSERLEGVRIPIWSTKLLTGRWFGPAPSVAESDLIPAGLDRLAGTVTNKLNVPLHDAIVAFNKQIYSLGELAPGENVRVELKPNRQLSGLLRDQSASYAPENAYGARRIDRANLALALMFHDSQGAYTNQRKLASVPLHYLDLTGLLALDRPMLIARIDGPASQIALGNSPAEPMVEQTTMLRVILPLGKAPE